MGKRMRGLRGWRGIGSVRTGKEWMELGDGRGGSVERFGREVDKGGGRREKGMRIEMRLEESYLECLMRVGLAVQLEKM